MIRRTALAARLKVAAGTLHQAIDERLYADFFSYVISGAKPMAKRKRKRLYVDRLVQGAILVRVFCYGMLCLLFATVPLSIVRTLMEPDRLLLDHFFDVCQQHWPILATLSALLPFVLYDVLKLSHRFAGPIFRVQNDLDRFARGEEIATMRFRDNDFWQDLGTKVDQLVRRCEAAESRAGDHETFADHDVHESVSSLG